jgi:hypothetical protein
MVEPILPSSGLLRVARWFETTFWDYLSVPSERVKLSKKFGQLDPKPNKKFGHLDP